MARPKTPSEPAVSRQEFYQLQQQVHFEAYSGRRHFSTSDLAETLGLSSGVREGMRVIVAVNPRVEAGGWTNGPSNPRRSAYPMTRYSRRIQQASWPATDAGRPQLGPD